VGTRPLSGSTVKGDIGGFDARSDRHAHDYIIDGKQYIVMTVNDFQSGAKRVTLALPSLCPRQR